MKKKVKTQPEKFYFSLFIKVVLFLSIILLALSCKTYYNMSMGDAKVVRIIEIEGKNLIVVDDYNSDTTSISVPDPENFKINDIVIKQL